MPDVPYYLVVLYYVSIFTAAIVTTAFPIAYSFYPWWRSVIGRALMTRALAFAILVDATLLFHFWDIKNVIFALWVNVLLWAFLGYTGAATLLTFAKRGGREGLEQKTKEQVNVGP